MAPTRVLDVGGWTDTWFARRGCVFNVAVRPLVSVRIDVSARRDDGPRVTIDAHDFKQRYAFDPEAGPSGPHPLIEAAVVAAGVPIDVALDVTVRSDAPPGASMGTSGSVGVALVAALGAVEGRPREPEAIARDAHRIETEDLGWQSGIQDQLSAAHGGINFIDIFDYPQATVTPLAMSEDVRRSLGERLVVVYLGRPHRSSAVHERVISALTDGVGSPALETLRQAAADARDALMAADWAGLGRAIAANTDAQRALHPELVSGDAESLIEIAARHGAVGAKVNGAGGDGGSVTIVAGDDPSRRRSMIDAISAVHPALTVLPVAIDGDGVRVWEEQVLC